MTLYEVLLHVSFFVKLPNLNICNFHTSALMCQRHHVGLSVHLSICLSVFCENLCWLSLIARFMGPIWGWQDSGGPHVGPINFAIWGVIIGSCQRWWTSHMATDQLWLHCTQSTSSINLIMQTRPWSCLDKSTQYPYVNVIASFPCLAALCPHCLWAQIVDQGLISPMIFSITIPILWKSHHGSYTIEYKNMQTIWKQCLPLISNCSGNFPNFELWYENHQWNRPQSI